MNDDDGFEADEGKPRMEKERKHMRVNMEQEQQQEGDEQSSLFCDRRCFRGGEWKPRRKKRNAAHEHEHSSLDTHPQLERPRSFSAHGKPRATHSISRECARNTGAFGLAVAASNTTALAKTLAARSARVDK
jgi:hypothetical protein